MEFTEYKYSDSISSFYWTFSCSNLSSNKESSYLELTWWFLIIFVHISLLMIKINLKLFKIIYFLHFYYLLLKNYFLLTHKSSKPSIKFVQQKLKWEEATGKNKLSTYLLAQMIKVSKRERISSRHLILTPTTWSLFFSFTKAFTKHSIFQSCLTQFQLWLGHTELLFQKWRSKAQLIQKMNYRWHQLYSNGFWHT